MINLIPALKASYQVDRLFLPDDAEVTLLRNNSTDTDYDEVRSMPKNGSNGHWTVRERNNKWNNNNNTEKYLVLHIIDQDGIKDDIDQTEVIKFQSRYYRFSRIHEPLYGSEPEWQLKLELMQWVNE